MRNDKKILIVSALNHLQERDPDWKHAKMLPKFKVLYNGWKATSTTRTTNRAAERLGAPLGVPFFCCLW